MAAGKIQLQAADARIYEITAESGASGNVALTVPKDGGKLAADSTVVHSTGAETVAGVKTFDNFPLTPSSAPIANYEVANKKYVDDNKAVDATSSVKGIDYKGLLAEYTVSGSAVTSIDFSGLDINTHKSYRVEIDLINVSGSGSLYVLINGDTTLTNYYSQIAQFNATSLSASRQNSPLVASFEAATSIFGANLNISIENSYATIRGVASRAITTLHQLFNTSIAKTATVTNITQLTFTSSVASAIGVGSKIRIYRGDV